jgi:hypothetical protein
MMPAVYLGHRLKPGLPAFALFALLVLLVPAAGAVTPSGLPGTADPDTVRTNLWLTEALMAEIVGVGAAQLPPPPAAVRLVTLQSDPRNDLFRAVAAKVLGERGYELYVPEADETRQGAVDYVFGFSVQNIKVDYPAVGRTLGLWRRWVARDLEVSALIEVSEEASGRLLLSERIVRRFGDRIGDGVFDVVDSDVYDFTTAPTRESGWQNRLEEVVVLGTLAGLVAIYFANTGN